ncbi:MAG: hypothetical protein AB1394_10480 [Bacteroidota bacterium]|jgi:hypothetical protein
MEPKTFLEEISKTEEEVAGVPTLKKISERFINRNDIQMGHRNWNNHRDYHKYTSSKHSIMCCGWTDWHDHKDS